LLSAGCSSECCGSDQDGYFVQFFHDFPSLSGANCSSAAINKWRDIRLETICNGEDIVP
jgi:hypothetical protein